jgi:methylated-DNA-[protein]-cysteine S-methyltransferase
MKTTLGFTLFDTAVGRCGIAWGERGIVGLHLPEESDAKARARIARRFPNASEAEPPAEVRNAIGLIVELLAGRRSDLSGIALDMDRVPDFARRVYAIARKIAPGETITYGELAEQLGDKLLAQEVGQAMGKNPFPIVVPCHRVVAANGKLGGFSAPGGGDTKLKLLAIEGAAVGGQPSLF